MAARPRWEHQVMVIVRKRLCVTAESDTISRWCVRGWRVWGCGRVGSAGLRSTSRSGGSPWATTGTAPASSARSAARSSTPAHTRRWGGARSISILSLGVFRFYQFIFCILYLHTKYSVLQCLLAPETERVHSGPWRDLQFWSTHLLRSHKWGCLSDAHHSFAPLFVTDRQYKLWSRIEKMSCTTHLLP